jgi:hypothetical protein
MYLKVFTLSVLMFLLNVLVFIVFRQLTPSPVIFYQGLIVMLVMVFLYLAFYIAVQSKFKLNFKEAVPFSIIISSLLFYSFHITVPSLLDRSISLYIIALTGKHGRIMVNDYHRHFISGFIEGNKAIEKRIEEQVLTGNLVVESGYYKLTSRGQRLQEINNILVSVFNTDARYVRP